MMCDKIFFRVLKFVRMCDKIFAKTYDRCINLIVVAKQPPAYKITASHLLWELNHDRGNFDPVFALRLRKGPFASLSRVNEPVAACLSFRRVFRYSCAHNIWIISESLSKTPAWQNNWVLNFLTSKCRIGKTLEGQQTRSLPFAKILRERLSKYLDWAHFVQTQPENSPA